MCEEYLPRLFDDILKFALKSKGAVLVIGPKWCGKSTTSAKFAKSIIDFTNEETKEQYFNLAKISPLTFLSDGEKPLLIDEWQDIPFIWNSIKYYVDKTNAVGQFILTGSVVDNILYNTANGKRHTGIGRITRKVMRTMSLYESRESNGKVSLSKLKDGEFEPCFSDKRIEDYAYYICRGGWPFSIQQEREIALSQAVDYYEALINDDIFSLNDIKIRKNVSLAKKILRSYAKNIASRCSDNVILQDVSSGNSSFNIKTLNKYLLALERLFVIEELDAWNPNLRSKIAIRKKKTRYFVDPSIGAASLGVGPEGLFKDIKTFRLLFESLAIRDLRIYADTIGAKVYHYRDKLDREADAVIEFRDGSYALIEVKLGNEEDIDMAAKKLIKLNNDIDEEKTGKLSFLMVITKGVTAYRRDDGVYEVPLACLKN